jgi:hypothetical protein
MALITKMIWRAVDVEDVIPDVITVGTIQCPCKPTVNVKFPEFDFGPVAPRSIQFGSIRFGDEEHPNPELRSTATSRHSFGTAYPDGTIIRREGDSFIHEKVIVRSPPRVTVTVPDKRVSVFDRLSPAINEDNPIHRKRNRELKFEDPEVYFTQPIADEDQPSSSMKKKKRNRRVNYKKGRHGNRKIVHTTRMTAHKVITKTGLSDISLCNRFEALSLEDDKHEDDAGGIVDAPIHPAILPLNKEKRKTKCPASVQKLSMTLTLKEQAALTRAMEKVHRPYEKDEPIRAFNRIERRAINKSMRIFKHRKWVDNSISLQSDDEEMNDITLTCYHNSKKNASNEGDAQDVAILQTERRTRSQTNREANLASSQEEGESSHHEPTVGADDTRIKTHAATDEGQLPKDDVMEVLKQQYAQQMTMITELTSALLSLKN